jgi:hypothetical protein
MRGILRNSLLRNSLLRNSLLRNSLLRNSLLRNSLLRNSLLGWGTALCLVMLAAGCSQSHDERAVRPAAPVTPMAATGAAKPSGGMVAGSMAQPAPPGVQTGDYAGGRK